MGGYSGRRFCLMLTVSMPLLLITAGCSSLTGGKGFSLFPQGHKLTNDAKAMRAANIGPLALPRELEKQPLAPYVVEPGDVLLVQPVELDSPARLPGDQPILPDGTIHLGKYGQLMVMGRTVAEIEQMVKEAVEAKTKEAGFISVRLVSRQSKVYYVVGEVNAPGAFPLQGRETVLDAIMAAGGLTDQASANNIILSRPSHPADCRMVLPIRYKDIVQLGDTTTNYQIAPGDRVFVPSRTMSETLFGDRCDKAPCGGIHFPCPPPAAPAAPASNGHEAPLTLPISAAPARDPQPAFRAASASGAR
jgi:polysaccharide export outer membrane protein